MKGNRAAKSPGRGRIGEEKAGLSKAFRKNALKYISIKGMIWPYLQIQAKFDQLLLEEIMQVSI